LITPRLRPINGFLTGNPRFAASSFPNAKFQIRARPFIEYLS
jgi:hypothetical protein